MVKCAALATLGGVIVGWSVAWHKMVVSTR